MLLWYFILEISTFDETFTNSEKCLYYMYYMQFLLRTSIYPRETQRYLNVLKIFLRYADPHVNVLCTYNLGMWPLVKLIK